ncbi:ABC transporter substrate-binding protein [Insulibacter thermoxylanivorax]|uniref:ABC transporter substrate-binding protein n=1 Tax=Insulibacter thermoxylanivorax TaxID=2749268 RepID=A0A916QAN9_9BACL|nr:ABC transporter substrate-binding protein [Insulibacter thermoxylanivorax]GFR37262.1 ABC transporter substrate-binding protein [Insulibacter thermoxylanivorax]
MRKALLIILSLAFIFALSACASGSDPANNTPTNQALNENHANNADESRENDGQTNDPDTDERTYKIGITQYLEHPSLDATREGILDALKEAGIEEGVNLVVDYHTAQADSTNNLSIANKLAGGDYDLVIAISTPSSIPLAQQLEQSRKDTPMLFAAVTDPVHAGLVDSLDNPGGHITGAADFDPQSIDLLMDFIAEHIPGIEKVGLIINTGEPNARVMADQAKEALAKHGIELIEAQVTNTSEVQQAAQSLVGQVQAFYITLDNSVVAAVNAIIQIAEAEGIPLFAADRDTVEGGAVAAYGFDYYEHGYQAGEMAVEILKNGKSPAELPVRTPQNLDLILNMPAAKAQGVEVTDEMIRKVNMPELNLIEE